ncbi:MAG: hypothetical protein CL916_09305 [Deltaproteobacteria bacterium]|nr:hypothetical protein [Deltaproteobacteria bacterium]
MSAKKSLLHDRYELRTILGKGGQATVYRAFDHVLQVERAIKLLSKDLMRNNDARGRFEAEAQAMAKLHHPSIVRLYDIVSTNNSLFLVMDIIDGGNSWEWVRAYGKMPEKMVCLSMLDIVDAVGSLHRSGIIHRDIKPSNLLISSQGKLLITDFGIARFHRPEEQQTQTGVVMGTYGYMAPEQLASARLVTPQSDVFALGASIYALSTAKVPKDLFMVKHKPSLLEGLSEPLRQVILNACAYEKEERFLSTLELRKAIVETIKELPDIPLDTISLKQQAVFCSKKSESPISEQELVSVTWKNEVEPTFIFDTSIPDHERTETNWIDSKEGEINLSKKNRFLKPYSIIGLFGIMMLVFLLQWYKSPPLPNMRTTCQELANHLLSQQKKTGGFSGIVQAGASLWDSGQQFYALKWAKSCGVYKEKEWERATSYLEKGELSRHAIDLAWASLALSSPNNTNYLEKLSEHRLSNGMYAFQIEDEVGDWYTTLLVLWAYCDSDLISVQQREETLHVLIEKMDNRWLAGLDEQLMWIRLHYASIHPELMPKTEELDSLMIRIVERCGFTSEGCTTIRWPTSQLESSKDRFTLSFHGRPWAIALLVQLSEHPNLRSDPRVDGIFRWLIQREYDSRGELMSHENYRLSEHVFALGVYENRSQ